MVSSKNILISGAGVAGPALALLLHRHGHKVTVVERSPETRISGQQIDITGAAIDVVKRLGVMEEIQAHTAEDEGITFVDESGHAVAFFPAANNGFSLVREIEILRSDLARILFDHSKDSAEFIFGDRVTAIDESEDGGVKVRFANSKAERTFDLVVAADGLYSRTRGLVFPPEEVAIKPLGNCCALMTIPRTTADAKVTRACTMPGGRTVCLRPHAKNDTTGAYLCVTGHDLTALSQKSVEAQKAAFIDMFEGVGWETKRILGYVQDSSDFYIGEAAQVKMSSWSKGRVVLLGDAAYAPSPLTGQGTALALTGAYILAGCICSSPDLQTAFQQYEKDMRPFVDKAQTLLPGVPGIANPQTTTGIFVLRCAFRVVSLIIRSGLPTLLAPIVRLFTSWFGEKELDLPRYKGFDVDGAKFGAN